MDERREAVDILLAEDDDAHAHLIALDLRELGHVREIHRAKSGQAVLDFVRKAGSDQPHLRLVILLDISMPGMDGLRVLAELKADPLYRHVPVIMLTTTDNPQEIRRCYELGCALYVTKPMAYDDFSRCIRRIGALMALAHWPPVQRSLA